MADKPVKIKAHFQFGAGGAAFFFISAMVLITAIYTQANLLFWSFGLLVGGFVVSATIAHLMIRAIVVERVLPMHGVAGEPLVMRYQVTNRSSWLPVFGVVVGEQWHAKPGTGDAHRRLIGGSPTGWVLHVGPKQSVIIDAVGWPLERGRVHFEAVNYWTSFPCGVIRRIAAFDEKASLLIYPKLYRVRRDMLFRLARGDHSGRHRVDVAGGVAEFYGMREYRPGDSLKMIDWKRSARTGELVSREMNQSSPPKVIILLDFTKLSDKSASTPASPSITDSEPSQGRDDARPWWRKLFGSLAGKADQKQLDTVAENLRQAERAIALAASLICEGYLKGYRVGLNVTGVPSQAFPPHHSVVHRAEMLQSLAMLELDKQAAGAGRVFEAPSVVVRIGTGELRMTDRAFAVLVLGSRQLEDYTSPPDDGTSSLLATRSQPIAQPRQSAVAMGAAV